MDVRSYLYVDDLVEGFLRAVEKYAVGEALNLAGPRPATIRDVVRLLLDILEFRPKVVFRTDKPSTVSYKVSDSSRARELLRWRPQVGLEEGLKRTVDWYGKVPHVL
jgi:nucleoside-diphosphate-sugar epimerase